jgi:hypothetical protein
MDVSKSDPIAIVGGGAFGLSTALELSTKGYTNITVFEKDEEIPSRWSAANDLNKIMRAEYEDDFYTNLAVVSFLDVLRSDEPKGSDPRLANSSICALLPPCRLSKLRFRCCTTKSSGHDAQVPSSC